MINKDSDIEIIISKYLSKEAIPEEIKVLDDWISAAPENYRSFLSQKNVWEVSHPAFNPEEIDVDSAHRKVMEKILHQNQPVSVRPKLSFLHYWQQVAASGNIREKLHYFIGKHINRKKYYFPLSFYYVVFLLFLYFRIR